MTLMYKVTITMISPHNSDVLKSAEEVIQGLHNKSEDLMMDMHIWPVEGEKADE